MPGNVLIVDDSATVRYIARRTIELARLDTGTVYEACDGAEALAVLQDHDIAVMILDLNMPTMNGIQLLSRMRINERLRRVSVLVASSDGSQERINQLRRMGAVDYVRKPFRPERLRDILKPLLGVKDEVESGARGRRNGVC